MYADSVALFNTMFHIISMWTVSLGPNKLWNRKAKMRQSMQMCSSIQDLTENELSVGEFQCFSTFWCYQQTFCLLWPEAMMKSEWMSGRREKDRRKRERKRNRQQRIGHVSFLPNWALTSASNACPHSFSFHIIPSAPALLLEPRDWAAGKHNLSEFSSASSAVWFCSSKAPTD